MGYPKKITTVNATGGKKTITFQQHCRDNDTDRAGGLALMNQWLADGSWVRRPDGAFTIIRYVPSKRAIREADAKRARFKADPVQLALHKFRTGELSGAIPVEADDLKAGLAAVQIEQQRRAAARGYPEVEDL